MSYDSMGTPSPFDHLDPSVWRASKGAHITLTVVGTLLLGPAALVIFIFWETLASSVRIFTSSEEYLLIGSAMTGSVSGGFAWCALCLLYFKRNDLRWQQAAWSTCAIFGYLTIPCTLGWVVWIGIEHAPAELLLSVLLIFSASVFCATLGTRYAGLACRIRKHGQRGPSEHAHRHHLMT